MSQVDDFIPYYPSILDSDFNDEVMAKKEFREEMRPGESVLRHQKLVSRYISPHTVYDNLLVFHEMGTGKTCTAISSAEAVFSANVGISKALVILRGQSMIDNFISEIVNVCARDTYKDIADTKRVRSKLLAKYEFDTYEMFAKRMSTGNYAMYDNHVIIVDEVHNINTRTKRDYNIMHDFLHNVKNCKILLMSGTPMRDKTSEIAEMMNLILPYDRQMATDKEFYLTYMDFGKVAKHRIPLFKSYFKGTVSYLKSSISDVTKVFEGRRLGELTSFKVVPSFMGEFQTSAYNKAFLKEDDIYISARQASLLVYPDSMYGSSGFDNNIKRQSRTHLGSEKYTSYTVTSNQFAQDIKTIEGVRRLSTKYATVLETVMSRPEELAFVYGEFVEGSGLIALSKIFEAAGYTRADGAPKTKGRRYALIVGATSTPHKMKKILKAFNHPDNMYGEYIQVVIGSRIVSEGLTLKNVSQVHILTPHWNYSETDQVIARAYRSFSHDALISDGNTPVLRIFQHVAVPKSRIESIDLKMYEVSEGKDIQIKKVERVIKEAAFDCPANVSVNYSPGHDNTRICEYQECAYSCDASTPGLPVDASTYNMYYSDRDVTEVSGDIAAAAIIGEPYTATKVAPIIAARALALTKTVTNGFGVTGYTNIDGDRVYASPGRFDDGDSGNMYYFTNPVINISRSFDTVAEKYLYRLRVPALLSDLREFPDRARSILPVLPGAVVEKLLEKSFVAPPSDVRKNVQQFFKKYIHTYDGHPVVSLMYKDTGRMRIMTDSGVWEYADNKVIEEVTRSVSDIADRAGDIGYYGMIRGGKFFIKKVSREQVVDKRKAPRGRACSTIDRAELDDLSRSIGIPVDSSMSKVDVCDLIQTWFDENNLIDYM